jgi:hypothetical protein
LSGSLYTSQTLIEVQGYHVTGDGGGGGFYWDASNAITDNGGTVIKPTAVVGNGRWVRIVLNGVFDPRMFGAKPIQSFDSYSAFQGLLNWCDTLAPLPEGFTHGVSLHIPSGHWRLSASLRIKRQMNIYGDGVINTTLHFQNNYPVGDSPIDGIVFDKDDGPSSQTLLYGGAHSTLRDIALVGDGVNHDVVTPAMPALNDYTPLVDDDVGFNPGSRTCWLRIMF